MRSYISWAAQHAQHTAHSIPCTAQHAQHTTHSRPCTAYHAQHTMHSMPRTAYYARHTMLSTSYPSVSFDGLMFLGCVHSPLTFELVWFNCRSVEVLHLATNIRYVFDCCDWLNKKCKNERMLMKPWVQRPPLQPRDWRVTEVYPAQVYGLPQLTS